MDEHDRKVVHSRAATGGKDNWQTPIALLDLVRQLSPDGSIGLDPCGGPGDCVYARARIDLPDDGLAVDWCGHGLVFCNPPYSKVRAWLRKFRETPVGASDQLVALVASRTDTKAWHSAAPCADAICFVKGRVCFHDPSKDEEDGPAPFPSALLYRGSQALLFSRIFGGLGHVVTP